MEKKWLETKCFLHPTWRARTGNSVSSVSILCSSEEERKIRNHFEYHWTLTGQIQKPISECFKVLNRGKYSLSTAFMKNSLKILDTYMHTKGILVRFTHVFFLPLPPDLLEAHFFPSKSVSSIFVKTNLTQLLLPTCTWKWCHPLRHGQPLQWALFPNKNDSPSISSHQLWRDLLWGRGASVTLPPVVLTFLIGLILWAWPTYHDFSML